MTTTTSYCTGWMDSCTPECTPNTNVSTTNTPRLVDNKASLLPSTQSDVSIGDVASGVAFGMAVKPCVAPDDACEGGDGVPEVCANGCSGSPTTGCTQCECKYTIGKNFNMNLASGINAAYYDDPALVIREYPNTINWYNGKDLDTKDVYSLLKPVSGDASPSLFKPAFTVRNDLLFSFMRMDVNSYRVDAAGRRIYKKLAGTSTVKYSSQVAVICNDRKTDRYYYLALSSVAGYDTPNSLTPLASGQFLYTAWRDAWAVWRTMPFSYPDEVYGDGVWTVWDDQNTTKSMREGGTFQLQNWLLATSVNPGMTSAWDEAYTDVPSDLSDIQSRTGYLSRYINIDVRIPGEGATVYSDYKTEYTYFNTACLHAQYINSGYEGADNTGSQTPLGANRQYFGAPLMGVNKTLQSLRDNAAGITDATTCVTGTDSNVEGEGVDPDCLCTDSKQFYTWFVSAYRGCIADAPTTFPELPSGTTTAITTRTPVWTYIVMGALGLLILIALGVIIWLVVRNTRPSRRWAEPMKTAEMFSMEDDAIM